MNRQASAFVLVFLLAGMLLISGAFKVKKVRSQQVKNLPILAKGMK
jgi:hypothetical protein